MLLLHDYVKNYGSEDQIIFNYNQTIDKISHWNLKPRTINITTKHYYKNVASWFSWKKKALFKFVSGFSFCLLDFNV